MLEIYEFLNGKKHTLTLSNGETFSGTFKYGGRMVKFPRREYRYYFHFVPDEGNFIFDMGYSEQLAEIAENLGYLHNS